MKNNAIFIPSSNRFAFALANVLMSIVDNSSTILTDADVIVLTDDMCEKNRQVIRKIIPYIKFVPLFKDFPSQLLDDKDLFDNRWGIYVLQSLYGFELIKQYEQVLGLETDMYVMSDISDLFNLDCDIAWRNVIPWNPKILLNGVLRSSDDNVFAPNAGVVVFKKSLNRYHVDKNSYLEAYEYLKSVKIYESAAISEKIFCYLCYIKKMKLKSLDLTYNNPTEYDFNPITSKIIHFIGSSQKPWLNKLLGSLMPEWFINHRKFLLYGGICEETICAPDISRKKIYDAVEYGGWAISLIPNLDIIKKKYIEFKYNQGSRTIRFFVCGWPKCIYYEIKLHVVNVTIELNVEEPFLGSSATVNILQKMEKSLKDLLIRYEMVKEAKRLYLIAWSNKNDICMINFLMNSLLIKTYPEMNAVLCGSETIDE